MNLTYIIGTLIAIVVMVLGMMFRSTTTATGKEFSIDPEQIFHFFDPSSILIVIGCTLAVIIASFPRKMLKQLPKHFGIMLNEKRYDPMYYVDQLAELAQLARKNGLLSLEDKANDQTDPFFKQAIMLIVDASDPDKVRSILNNSIECMTARHDDVASMYEKAAAVSPAFGMVGTLLGLINMLANMNLESGSSSIGGDMSTALVTTLYGCILAHTVFGPIATNLRTRDEEEVLCKMIIVEGILSIQSGETPVFLRERLLTFMAQQQQDVGGEEKKGGKGKKKTEKKQ